MVLSMSAEDSIPASPTGGEGSVAKAKAADNEDLPEDWRMSIDEDNGRTYYWNVKTREVSWFRPEDGSVSADESSPPSNLVSRLARRRTEDDSATSTPASQKRRAAQRWMAALQSGVSREQDELSGKYMNRSPTKMLRARSGSGTVNRGSEGPGEDTFARRINLLNRREQPPVLVDDERAEFLAWLDEAYGTEKGSSFLPLPRGLGFAEASPKRGDTRDFDKRIKLTRDPAGPSHLPMGLGNPKPSRKCEMRALCRTAV